MLHYIRKRFHPLWQLRRFRPFLSFQEICDPDVAIDIEGTKAYVKLLRDAALVFDRGDMEEETRDAFRTAIRDHRAELFFDIGANIGIYSWTALANGVPEVFMVEADATNQRLVAKTIRKNSLDRCHLVPFAMSDSVGTAQFMVDAASGAAGALEGGAVELAGMRERYGMKRSRTVATLSLDVFTPYATGKRTIVKIDVEGAEGAVFQGAESFIENVAPVIIVECFDRSRLAFFERKGYTITELPEHYNYILKPRDWGKMPQQCATRTQ